MRLLKEYYRLMKPGIVYGNAVTAVAGFALASSSLGDRFEWRLLLTTLVGISFVVASGCVFNNYLDRDIDGRMERTKNRALVTGVISGRVAIAYATVLGLVGVAVLARYVNLLATGIALVGFFVYVALYSPLKRRTMHATVIGSVAGAVPPLVGYCAAVNRFDAGTVILFFILVFWQMPHFYAIAIYRLNDYIAASIPVLPAKKGIRFTKITMLVYIIAFIIAVSALNFFGYAGHVYLAIMVLLGLAWFAFGVRGFKVSDDKLWARRMFFFSLVIILSLCVTIVARVVIPGF
jgi:protoheme IX farnesyltransferase